MRIAVVFDSPYASWGPEQHAAQMQQEVDGWDKAEPEPEYQVANALQQRGHEVTLIGVRDDPSELSTLLTNDRIELAFNLTESFRNNDSLDYLLPALIEAAGFPYTGAPPLALMVTRNKALSKKILGHHGIRVPSFHTFRLGEKVSPDQEFAFPQIVKPLQMDASAGISQASVVQNVSALSDRVDFIHDRFKGPAIVEQFIDGRELYVSIIGNGDKLEILPAVELVFDKKTKAEERIATKAAKWDEPYRKRKGIKNVIARPISRVAQETIEHSCRTAFRVLWLRDYARLDIRLDAQDNVWVLEANANPYISYGHEISQAAAKAGLKHDALIQRIVDEALARTQ